MYTVKYWRRCIEWHEKSMPYIVDGEYREVMQPTMSVYHPGLYDEKADRLCHKVVNLLNSQGIKQVKIEDGYHIGYDGKYYYALWVHDGAFTILNESTNKNVVEWEIIVAHSHAPGKRHDGILPITR